jgi:hypothetical protein
VFLLIAITTATIPLNETNKQTNKQTTTQSEFDPTLNLTVVSKGPDGPRVFLVTDLLSDFECDHIMAQGEQVGSVSIVTAFQ